MHEQERESPVRREVMLLVGFALIVIAALLTVVLPELREASHPHAERANESRAPSTPHATGPSNR